MVPSASPAPFHVDDREPFRLRAPLVALGASVRRLACGDVRAGPWLIERKTPGDLVASLADGRLFAQVAGLRASGLSPLLVVEGPLTELTEEGRDPRLLASCHGALACVVARFGVPVVPTSCADGTVALVRSLLRRTPGPGRDMELPAPKVRALPPDVAMLAQVPGVGPLRARSLLAERSVADLTRLPFPALVDEAGPVTASAVWRALHGRDVPEVWRRIGVGKRARRLVEAAPGLCDGEAVPREIAQRVLGRGEALARLGDLVSEDARQSALPLSA